MTGEDRLKRSSRLLWAAAPAVLAIALAALAAEAQAPARPGADAPTPKLADGHPDLTGFWGPPPPPPGPQAPNPFGAGPSTPDANGEYIQPMNLRNGDISNLTNDGVIGRRSTDNLPLYKPKYWDKVEDEDYNGNKTDPFNTCMPPGVPRMGVPRKIVMLPNEALFFYAIGFQRNDFRIVPIAAKRAVEVDRDGLWQGYPLGHWEGDTFVVETVGFNNESWIGPQGYVHGYDMKVTERFRRVGNRMTYESTVEDPEFLQKPWVRDPQTLALITGPAAQLGEAAPCSDRNINDEVGKQREM
jgi:hypothetical protein